MMRKRYYAARFACWELHLFLDTHPNNKEAARRLEHYGPNELQEGGRKSVLRIFLEQFADFLVIILILAAVVSAILGDVESMAVILRSSP